MTSKKHKLKVKIIEKKHVFCLKYRKKTFILQLKS